MIDFPRLSDDRLRHLMAVHARLMRVKGLSPVYRSACADTVIALGQLIALRDADHELSQCINAMVARTMETVTANGE